MSPAAHIRAVGIVSCRSGPEPSTAIPNSGQRWEDNRQPEC